MLEVKLVSVSSLEKTEDVALMGCICDIIHCIYHITQIITLLSVLSRKNFSLFPLFIRDMRALAEVLPKWP